MDALSWSDFLSRFDPSVHAKLAEARSRDGVDALVLFENLAFDSSAFGDRTALTVGPDCTYKSVDDCKGKWLNDLPSRRQYPVAYTTETATVNA